MKRATRIFLNDKKLISNKCRFVSVKPIYIDGALLNHCYQNASKLCDTDEKYIIQSGWLIGDYFGKNGTAIIPHYWVIDSETHIAYDSTPFNDNQNFDYVFDFTVMEYASPQSILPPCLKLLDNGKYLIRLDKDYFIDADTIETSFLYQKLYEAELL